MSRSVRAFGGVMEISLFPRGGGTGLRTRARRRLSRMYGTRANDYGHGLTPEMTRHGLALREPSRVFRIRSDRIVRVLLLGDCKNRARCGPIGSLHAKLHKPCFTSNLDLHEIPALGTPFLRWDEILCHECTLQSRTRNEPQVRCRRVDTPVACSRRPLEGEPLPESRGSPRCRCAGAANRRPFPTDSHLAVFIPFPDNPNP